MNSVLLTETMALLAHQPPPLGIRRCPGPLPSENARWPRESTISSSPRCERCRYHARLHPLHRGFHWVGAPGYGELAVTDGFVEAAQTVSGWNSAPQVCWKMTGRLRG